MIYGVARVTLAAVFLIGALAKLADRDGSRQAITAFGIPARAAGALGFCLIGCELAIAIALVVPAVARPGAIAAILFLATLSTALAANLLRGRTPECACFGRLSRGPIGWSTLARNGLLAVVAGYVAAGPQGAPLFGTLAVASASVWLLLGPGKGIRTGAKAPGLSLADADGRTWTLPSLLAGGRPVLLVFSQPGCGACLVLDADLQQWHERLGARMTIATVTPGLAPGTDTERSDWPVLLDPSQSVASSYGITATPSAVLIESGGTMAAAPARGGGEIAQLVGDRFEGDAEPRFARRALLTRSARAATALGAFPLLAAACGSSKSSSTAASSTSATTPTTTKPVSVKVGDAYICNQKYALCTNAACRPDPHDPNLVICDCVVEEGYSVGLKPCPQRAPQGTRLHSEFSTQLVDDGVLAMTCPADVPWANCLDYPCTLDPNDSTKATCQCALVKQGPSFTFGGDCKTSTCGKTVWSGAHNNVGSPQVAAEMKRLGQPLAIPQPCPKA